MTISLLLTWIYDCKIDYSKFRRTDKKKFTSTRISSRFQSFSCVSRSSPKPSSQMTFGFAPKPGHLSLGVITDILLGLLNRAFQTSLAAQEFANAPVTVRAERVGLVRQTFFAQTVRTSSIKPFSKCLSARSFILW